MKKLHSSILLVVILLAVSAGAVNAAQVAVVPTDTRQQAWAKETLNNSDLQANIDVLSGEQANIEALTDSNGFPDKTSTALSFADLTRTLTISATDTDFIYYIDGKSVDVVGSDSVIIADVEGLHVVYYNDDVGTLASLANPNEGQEGQVIRTKAIVAYVYWNATDSESYYFADERHGISMSPETHSYLHFTRGAQYLQGLGASDVAAHEDGSLDAHAQFGVDGGFTVDEDSITVSDDIASTVGLPIYYITGAGADLRRATYAGFSVLTDVAAGTGATGRLVWNENNGSTWQLSTVNDSDFVLCHTFQVNGYDGRDKQIAVIGQGAYDKRNDARDAAQTEITSILTGFPFEESVPLQTFIFEVRDSYTNSVSARIEELSADQDYIDWRATELAQGTAASSHSNLTNLELAALNVTYGHIDDQAQTIYGVKTFNSYPEGPAIDPTTDNQLATKRYVDENGGSGSFDPASPGPIGATLPDTVDATEYRSLFENGKSSMLWPDASTILPDLTGFYGITSYLGDMYKVKNGVLSLIGSADYLPTPVYSDSGCVLGNYSWDTSYYYICDGDADWDRFAITRDSWSNPTPTPNNYYLASAANGGSDSNDGLTTGTPWETVAKVNGTFLNRGDTVNFNRGDSFKTGLLDVDESGTVEDRIVYTAYGTGDLPILLGVRRNGTLLQNVTMENLHIQGDVLIPESNYGFTFGASFVNFTVQNCEISNNRYHGYSQDCVAPYILSNVVLENNNIHDNNLSGIRINAGESDSAEYTIRNNTLQDNVKDPAYVLVPGDTYGSLTLSGSTGLVENNYIDSAGGDPTIQASGASIVFEYATVRYNSFVGAVTDAAFSAKSNDDSIYYIYSNIFTDGVAQGIQCTLRKGVGNTEGGILNFYNNVIAYNGGAGLFKETSAPSYLYNNIFYNNGVIASWNTSHIFTNWPDDLVLDPQSNINSDYNIFYNASLIPINRNRNIPTDSFDTTNNFAEWQAIPHDLSSTEQNPLFVDPTNGDFRLQAGSPALVSGTVLSSPYDQGITYGSTIAPNNINISLISRLPNFDKGPFQAE